MSFKKDATGHNHRIRYMNVQVVFNMLVMHNKDALAIKQQKQQLIQEIKSLEIKPKSALEPAELAKYQDARKALGKLDQEEAYYKKKLLSQINAAIKNIATEQNIDFVLRIGEEAIFARKEFDITEDVLREIIRLEKRSAPVSR